VPWNWGCKLWANWNASSHPAEMPRLPVGSNQACRNGRAGEAARSGRSAAKGRGETSHVVWLKRAGLKDWELKPVILDGDWTFVTRNSVTFSILMSRRLKRLPSVPAA